ncbi:MAG: NADPH:quinone oxidoreductase family protein [Minwuia sp.]|uniref:NADPH:quinone oxidoreductase family protein n=1 Tax=Minwuia sp. TaxID=2493630 RepID=UPI003A898E1F
MKAIVCSKIGSIDDLTVGDLPKPSPGPGEVLVQVKAAALNFPDVLMPEGKYQYAGEPPFAPGMEAAGIVAELGPGVSGVSVGDRVAVHPWVGCFAEYVVSPVDWLFRLPDEMDWKTAAAFCLTYGTIRHALVDRGELKAGESLLVLGASGGTGLAAIEGGKALGATVIAAASSAEKLAVCKGRGADILINYAEGPELRHQVKEATGGQGADVIFDSVGGDFSQQAIRSINWGGRMLVIGFAAGSIAQLPANHILIKQIELVGVAYQGFSRRMPDKSRANMAEMFDWWQQGKLHPHIGGIYSLDTGIDALKAMRDRKAEGKLIIEIG